MGCKCWTVDRMNQGSNTGAGWALVRYWPRLSCLTDGTLVHPLLSCLTEVTFVHPLLSCLTEATFGHPLSSVLWEETL